MKMMMIIMWVMINIIINIFITIKSLLVQPVGMLHQSHYRATAKEQRSTKSQITDNHPHHPHPNPNQRHHHHRGPPLTHQDRPISRCLAWKTPTALLITLESSEDL